MNGKHHFLKQWSKRDGIDTRNGRQNEIKL